ncbi:sugar transferase [Synechocystis sp. PCC 7509]|uniref:sugar transferase n=1 Tax=Synechocystis sp. PCC 7509 TaxID=927677 RepID=UPI0002ACC27C|nr:sugar transferase [Synechocystis sp. PCC 7509]
MNKLCSKPRYKNDIRAPGKFQLQQIFNSFAYQVMALLLSDLLALALAWRFAEHWNKLYSPVPPQLAWWEWLGLPSLFWLFAACTFLLFAYRGLYSFSTQQKNYILSGQLVSVVYLMSLVLCYFYDPKLDPPRSLFFTAWFSSIFLVIGLRLVTTLILRQFDRYHPPVSVFLIANGDRLPILGKVLQRRSQYIVVGAALACTANATTTIEKIKASQAREVLVENLPPTELASTLYWQLRRLGITMRLIPSSLEMLHRRGVPEVFAGLPTLLLEFPLISGWDYRFKRLLDIFGALLGLIILSPIFIASAIAIKLSSPGSIFFCQERMGLHGKVFQVWKFRTMVANAVTLQQTLEQNNEVNDGVMFKIKNDPRITFVGRFLRRTSIDELPQLVNVLLGQMSLVGPRPLPLRDVERFATWHHIRHQVLPGITGLWQVSGRSNINDFADAVRLDLYYIDNWSFNLDLDILVDTVRIVLFGKGAY